VRLARRERRDGRRRLAWFSKAMKRMKAGRSIANACEKQHQINEALTSVYLAA
jgi:hypothetical protein